MVLRGEWGSSSLQLYHGIAYAIGEFMFTSHPSYGILGEIDHPMQAYRGLIGNKGIHYIVTV